jgi:hypothetical protein
MLPADHQRGIGPDRPTGMLAQTVVTPTAGILHEQLDMIVR